MVRRVCVVIGCLGSSIASAQPADPSTAPPPPTYPSQGPPQPYPTQPYPPQPYPSQPYPPQPYPPQPYPNQQPYANQPPPAATGEDALRKGVTVELNIGFGWIRGSADGRSDTSDLALGGLDIGVGGWLNPRLAIFGRIAGVTYSEGDGRFTDGFFGPSVQFWVAPQVFVGGGVGLGFLSVRDSFSSDSVGGISADLRAGVKLNSGSENTVNISFELNPGHYSRNGATANYTGIAFLVGYQHL